MPQVGVQTVIHDLSLAEAANLEFYLHTNWLRGVHYCGVPISKNPLDLQILHEILWDVRPQCIIELGTWQGGSALWLAHQCDALGIGHIFTVDHDQLAVQRGMPPIRPEHPRISYLHGDTTDPEILKFFQGVMKHCPSCLVIHDASHIAADVRSDLEAYSRFVTEGSYLIVEDTNSSLVLRPPRPLGPDVAITQFLDAHPEFTIDRTREQFSISFNFGGWLKRGSTG